MPPLPSPPFCPRSARAAGIRPWLCPEGPPAVGRAEPLDPGPLQPVRPGTARLPSRQLRAERGRLPARQRGARAGCPAARCLSALRRETAPVLSFPAGRRPAGAAPVPMLLPAWELCLYGLLTVGSHLYAFYEAHQVSRSKCATWAGSLGHSFPPVAGQAVRCEFSALGWFLLCSSARSPCVLPSCQPALGEEVVGRCHLGRELCPRAFLPLSARKAHGNGVLGCACQGKDGETSEAQLLG